MLKYYFFFKNSINESLVYRLNVFLMFLAQIFSLTIFIILWQAIYSQSNQIGGYSLNELISYYILSSFLGFIIQGVDVAWHVGDEINLGQITNFILRPINYFWATLAYVLGKVFFNFSLIAILILGIALFDFSLVENFFLSWQQIIFFGVSVLLSLGLFFNLFFLIGILTFWLGTIKGFNFFIRMVMFFLSGAIVPLDLLPIFLMKINHFLPFQYITWLPFRFFKEKWI